MARGRSTREECVEWRGGGEARTVVGTRRTVKVLFNFNRSKQTIQALRLARPSSRVKLPDMQYMSQRRSCECLPQLQL